MKKYFQLIKREFLEVLPPTIFFFIAFCLIMMTKVLVLKQYDIHFTNFAGAAVGALIVGKVVLIVDKFNFVNKFPEKPLIYNVVWKTVIYVSAVFLVRYFEHIYPLLNQAGGFFAANQLLLQKIVWSHFWLIQMWLIVLFFVFAALREVIRYVGRDEVINMFFGKRDISE